MPKKKQSPTPAEPAKRVAGVKGFDRNLQCFGFQYELGKTFIHDGPTILCSSGLHFVENPLDIFRYYDPTQRFAAVEGEDVSDEQESDSKRVAKTLHIGAELSIRSLIDMGVKFAVDKVDFSKADGQSITKGHYSTAASSGDSSTAASSGDYSKAASSGNYSTAASSGHYSKAASSGYYSKAASSGHYSTAASSGDSSKAASSGDCSKAASSGDYSTAASSGHSSKAASSGHSSTAASSGYSSTAASSGDSSTAASSGDYSTAASSGDYSKAASSGDSSKAASSGTYSTAEAKGKNAIAMVAGLNGCASAGKNGCFALPWNDGMRVRIITGYVGEDGLEPDTFYRVIDGKLAKA